MGGNIKKLNLGQLSKSLMAEKAMNKVQGCIL